MPTEGVDCINEARSWSVAACPSDGRTCGRVWMRKRRMGKPIAAWMAGVLLAIALPANGAGAEVRPLGAFSLPLAGLSIDVGTKPRVLLWCQGPGLLGVVLPDD